MLKLRELGFMRWMDVLSLALLALGGIAWGLGGVFGIEAVTMVMGKLGIFSRAIYLLIGICALYEVFEWKAIPRRWECTLLTHSH